ncbi:putative RING-H2 finger protein ATL19 [Neltuma alba]|uniref:putative RING-H2 finger protein ATL19 n=1 Tax=Neltuma alba TaxID=207710 RepID=UPI0010A4E81B|nr:putative RING-H2 finger protein ATL19 [Prosopis alba]
MADQLSDSLATVRSSSGDDIIIGDSLQTSQYAVTFDLRTTIIIGFSVSLFFCVVYHILCSFFYRLIDTRIYHHRDVNVEEGTDLMPVDGDTSRSQHQVALFQALVLSNMQAWVMVGALMEDSSEEVDESRGEILRAMQKLPALVKYGSEHNNENNEVTRNCMDCVICLEDFKVGELCQVFPRCNHVFHSSCIDCWLATKLTCPTCRGCIT